MKIFSWKPADNMGIAQIDHQHQELFDIAQELYDALKRADGMAVADDVLNRLLGYCTEHFAAEEKLMELHHYPGFKSHQAKHREFTRTVLTFKRDLEEGKKSAVSAILPYLQSWIKDHIQDADHRLGEFMKTARQKAAGAGT